MATLHSGPGTSGFFFICHQEWEKKDEKRSWGKVCRRAGLLKLIILPLPASCTLVAFASIWLQDKDLFRHKLLVTNCYYLRRVHTEDCAWFAHSIHSMLKGSTVTIVVIILYCHATFLFLLNFNSTTNLCHKGCFSFFSSPWGLQYILLLSSPVKAWIYLEWQDSQALHPEMPFTVHKFDKGLARCERWLYWVWLCQL